MKKTMFAAIAAALALALSACQVTVTPLPQPEYDEAVTAEIWTDATLAGAPAAHSITLGPGESIRYRVSLPTSDLDAVYYELDQPLELTVYDRFDDPIASSTSSDFFARGTLALSSAAQTSITPAEVTAQLACRGSCVIERRSGSTRYVRVANPTDFTISVDVYFVLRDFEDTSESMSNPTLGLGSTEGALETLGDVDTYEVTANGDVELVLGAAASGLQYRLSIYSSSGTFIDELFVGDPPVEVFSGEEVRIDAVNGDDRAGSSGKSRYQIDLN